MGMACRHAITLIHPWYDSISGGAPSRITLRSRSEFRTHPFCLSVQSDSALPRGLGLGRIAIAVLIAAACAIPGAQAQSSRPLPPVDAFGRLPFITDARLSPDGKHFAAVQDLDGKPAAVVYQVNAPAGAEPHVYQDVKWILSGIEWGKNDRLILFNRTNHFVPLSGNPRLFAWYRALSVGTGNEPPVDLFNNNDSTWMNGTTGYIVDKDISDPDAIYLPLWTRPKNDRVDNDDNAVMMGRYSDLRLSIYKVSVHTGKAELVSPGAQFNGQWILDGHGNIVGRVDRLNFPLTDRLKLYRSGSWHDADDFDATADNGADIEGLASDGGELVREDKQARYSLQLVNLSTGKPGTTLYENPLYDVRDALHDDWTGRVIGAEFISDKPEYFYFDASREAVQRGIEAAFPGADAHAVSTTLAGDKMFVLVETPKQPATYYFLDRDTHQASKIASAYPDLTADDLGEMRAYPYKARDGLDIPAYLTLPPGRAGKMLPLVVMPHGGPDERDYQRFDWWAQFLANRGYAVFQPNFRGSAGYGQAFTKAGLHQWGLKMQDDITDGVRKLIADGVADPNRICIVGASYGGYAALAGATFTPDLYKCAASFAGVSNLRSMLQRAGAEHGDINTSHASFWISRIGDISKDSDQIDATSPALHADKVKIPILLMHGKGDTTVPIDQSEQERDALEAAGKKVTFVQYDGDDHYFGIAATRIGMLTQLEKFLHDNIGS